MTILQVENLCKEYDSFKLDNVSFSLEQGKITGFIGRNGAGKTTTIKSLLNLVHPSSGEIHFFGKSFNESENEIKERIGFVSGGINFYPKKKIKAITEVTKRFYNKWNNDEYKKYCELFRLDEKKTPDELSEGMKVKYNLALALSHNAELLILDEPTSGLDPVSRDELLDIFLKLARKSVTIMFSTHITSDLDKCADNIIYIKNGKIIAEENTDTFVNRYRLVEFEKEPSEETKRLLIGFRSAKHGFTALTEAENADAAGGTVKVADLEEIMVAMEKE